MDSMYTNLLRLPLFIGLCNDDITRIIEKTKLQFIDLKPGQLIKREYEKNEELLFILSGEVKVVTTASKGFKFIEQVSPPFVLEISSIFGLTPRYRSSYKAISSVKAIAIDKQEVLQVLLNYKIFKLNYINMLSTLVQKKQETIWNRAFKDSLLESFIDFVCEHTLYTKEKITIKIKMETLAQELHTTRIKISKLLNELAKKELIGLRRQHIDIHSLFLLKQYAKQR